MSGMLHRVLEFSVDPPTAGHHDHSPTWLPTWLPTCCGHARTMCLPAPADRVSIPSVGPTLGILIGLGAGIDYALFIVTRHRSNLKAGMPPQEAAVRALNTSGRAVLFAGTTVCIALIGMLVVRISYISGLGIAAAVTVLFTVAAAATLLPALLGFLGLRVLSRRDRRQLAANGPAPAGPAGWWTRLAAFVQRHPAPLAAAAAAVMLVLAIPVLSLRLGTSDAANDPASTTTHKAYELLAEGFGQGFNGPLQVVARPPPQPARPRSRGWRARSRPSPASPRS